MFVVVVISPGELLCSLSVAAHGIQVTLWNSFEVRVSSISSRPIDGQTFHILLRKVQKNLLLPVQSPFHEKGALCMKIFVLEKL